jgi:hypothetical protein
MRLRVRPARRAHLDVFQLLDPGMGRALHRSNVANRVAYAIDQAAAT